MVLAGWTRSECSRRRRHRGNTHRPLEIGAPDKHEVEKLNSQYTLEMLDGMQFPMGERGADGKRTKKKFSKAALPEPGQGGLSWTP